MRAAKIIAILSLQYVNAIKFVLLNFQKNQIVLDYYSGVAKDFQVFIIVMRLFLSLMLLRNTFQALIITNLPVIYGNIWKNANL
jgi:hypothetical protein